MLKSTYMDSRMVLLLPSIPQVAHFTRPYLIMSNTCPILHALSKGYMMLFGCMINIWYMAYIKIIFQISMFVFFIGELCFFLAICFVLVDLILSTIREGIYETAYSFYICNGSGSDGETI